MDKICKEGITQCQGLKELFIEFSNQGTDDLFMDHKEDKERGTKHISRKGTVSYMDSLLAKRSIKEEELRRVNPSIRNEIIKDLKEKSALSIREISEVLGLDRNIIQRVI